VWAADLWRRIDGAPSPGSQSSPKKESWASTTASWATRCRNYTHGYDWSWPVQHSYMDFMEPAMDFMVPAEVCAWSTTPKKMLSDCKPELWCIFDGIRCRSWNPISKTQHFFHRREKWCPNDGIRCSLDLPDLRPCFLSNPPSPNLDSQIVAGFPPPTVYLGKSIGTKLTVCSIGGH